MSPGLKARPVLMCLYSICRKYNKLYCYPSQKKVLELLALYQGEKKSIATLNRWLRACEDAGYLKRRRRIRRDKKLGMVFKSTLYMITKKGYYLLAMGGLVIWDILKKLDRGKETKKAEPGSGSGKEPYLSGVAPLSDIIGRVLKNPVTAEHKGSS